MAASKLVLAVSPKPRRYAGTADGAMALRDFLQAKDEAGPRRIRRKSELLLNEKTCRLQHKYRLTTAALGQICTMLCPGFGQMLTDVSGLRRTEREGVPPRYSPREAAKYFNAMIEFRGDRLVGNELILDRRSLTVEGLVGPEYQYFSNWEFWERVQEFLAGSGRRVLFQGAVYRSRRLSVRYRFKEPAFTLPARGGKREPFHGGWHFSNSEVGDCAVHMAAVLWRRWSNSVALASLPDVKKVVHRGAREGFTGKLDTMFGNLGRRAGVAKTLREPMERLVETPLGLGGEPKEHQKRTNALKARLVRGKLGPRLAKEVMQHLLFHGSYKADAIRKAPDTPATFEELQQATRTEVFEARTAFDLYNALGIRARYERPERQELAEQLAYRILVSQFTL